MSENEDRNDTQVRIEPKKKSKKWLIIVITVSLLVLGLGLGSYFIYDIVINKDDKEEKKANKKEENKNDNKDILSEEEKEEELRKYLEIYYSNFNIDGSTSMIPLHQSLEYRFSREIKAIEHSKTVDAFEKFIKGEIDILLGVTYSDDLLNKAQQSGIDLEQKEITKEGFVFLINKNNPVKSLTVEQIKDIYSGKIKNWKEVGGDDAPIKAYQRNSDSGSQIRMTKFMAGSNLKSNDVEYINSMGNVVERIGSYDEGKYSIAYNMYTFAEKQYFTEEVSLLKVNGVEPNDDTIFDETYPIIIYNYIYYDKNKESVSEFANILYDYLMSASGQKLISNSGYVNLKEKYDRDKDINITRDTEMDSFDHQVMLGFYDKSKGVFYSTDENKNLLTFNNYPDYVLRDSEYKNNAKAREFLMEIFNSNIILNPFTASIGIMSAYSSSNVIDINPWFLGAFDPILLFNIKYNGKYYSVLSYNIDKDELTLVGSEKNDNYDVYEKDTLKYYSKYINDVSFSSIKVKKEELKNMEFRPWGIHENGELTFYKAFK